MLQEKIDALQSKYDVIANDPMVEAIVTWNKPVHDDRICVGSDLLSFDESFHNLLAAYMMLDD